MTARTCSVEGCGAPTSAKNLCVTHYGRLIRFGDPAGRTIDCAICGTTFTRPSGRAITCSKDCAAIHRKRAKRRFDDTAPSRRLDRTCVECGKSFTGSTNQNTCSAECRTTRRNNYEAARVSERKKPTTPIPCAWCDQVFVPPTNAKTCSPDCRIQYERAKKAAKGRGLVRKLCVVCGAPFKTGGTSNRTLTCSAECRGKRATEKMLERRDAQNADRRGTKNRKSNLYRRFGITEDDYLRMLEEQGGRCAICQTDTPGGSGVFAVDHDHSTGAVRGLLCRACNVGIGNLGDDIGRLESATRYLKKHRNS